MGAVKANSPTIGDVIDECKGYINNYFAKGDYAHLNESVRIDITSDLRKYFASIGKEDFFKGGGSIALEWALYALTEEKERFKINDSLDATVIYARDERSITLLVEK